MPAGRPKELTPELIEKARTYIATCEDYFEKDIKKVRLPSIEGFALFLDISRDTVYEWEKQNEEFSDILDTVRKEQAKRLIDNGLSGNYNSTIAKLILTKHGYSDKQELTGKDGEKLEMGVVVLPAKNGTNEL